MEIKKLIKFSDMPASTAQEDADIIAVEKDGVFHRTTRKAFLQAVMNSITASAKGITLKKVDDLTYQLVNGNAVQGTISIPKDQFLKSAVYKNKTLVLTFETTEGTKETDIDLSDLTDLYTAGQGVTVSGNSISLKLKTGTKLTLDADGLDVDLSAYPTVTVSDMDTLYAVGDSSAPTTTWQETPPERAVGKVLWMKQVMKRSDGTSTESAPAQVTGDKGDAGPQGPQGIQGEKGEKGDTGTVAPDFILSASATSWAVSPRGVCHRDQTISVVCTRLGTDKPATWKLDPEWDASKMETSADTSILVLSADRGDSPVETVVTCSVAGAGSRTITISPVSDTADAPLYLGTDWDETETKTVEGDPLRTGDYYLKFTGDGNAVPRVYDEKAGWSDVEPGSASAAAICGTVLPDVLANKKNIQETSAALYAYIGTLAAQSASIRQLSKAVITSANYAEDSDGNPTAGYRLDGPKDVIKSANMQAMNASIKNSSLSNVSIANTLGGKGISITQEQENAPARKIMGTVASELSDPLEAEGEGGYSLVRDLSGQLSSGLVQASWSYNGKSGNAYWVRDGRLCLTNAYPVSPYWDLHRYAFDYGNSSYSYQNDPGNWRQHEQYFGADASGTACRLTDGSRLSDLNKGSFKGRGFKLLFYWRDTATGATWVSRGVTSMSFRVTFWFDYYKSKNCYWVDWLNGSGTKTLPSGVSISGVSAWSTGNISDRQVDVTATVRFSA